jgi:hypothetical protein
VAATASLPDVGVLGGGLYRDLEDTVSTAQKDAVRGLERCRRTGPDVWIRGETKIKWLGNPLAIDLAGVVEHRVGGVRKEEE